MTTRATVARHRAEVVKTNSLAVIAKAVGDNAGGVGRQAAVIAAASGLVLTSGIAANAADTNVQRESAPASAEVGTAPVTISAASTIAISYEKPEVTTTPAPVVEPEPVVEAPAAPAPKPVASIQVAAAVPTAPVAASSKGQAILSAAYAQLGVTQDCTAMVEKALRAVGKSVGDLAPGQFYQYGTVVGAPAPGDLVISAGHVGVYAGDGQMVSGGVNGSQTQVHSVSWVGAASYVRVA